MEKVYFQEGENYKIKRNKKIKITTFDISKKVEILDKSNSVNGFENIKKISKKEYYDEKLGQIVAYKRHPYKSKDSLSKSMKRLKNKLKNNFIGDSNELFITLTTEKPILQIQVIKSYFERFWNKLKNEYDGLEYTYVLEKNTNRKGWHIHLLVKDMKNKELDISNETIEKIWGKGFTKTSRVSSKTNAKTRINEYEDLSANKQKTSNTDEISNNEKEAEDTEDLSNDKEKAGNTEELFKTEKNKTDKEEDDDDDGDDDDDDDEDTDDIDKVIDYMCKEESKEDMPKYIRCFETSRNLKSPEIEVKTYDEALSKMYDDNYHLEKERTIIVRDINTKSIVNKIKKETWSRK